MDWRQPLVAIIVAAVTIGGSARALTSSAGDHVRMPDRQPTWSPDGLRIAFDRSQGLDSSAWLIRRNGTGAHRVSHYAPVWSPEGRRMAILDRGMLWLANGDGSHKQKIGEGADATWSPDGSVVAFTHQDRLHLVDRDGGGLRRLPIDVPTCSGCRSAEYDAAWSPDGQTLAFVHSDVEVASKGVSSVWAADIDGRNLRRISEGSIAESPAWSPDGSMVAFFLFDGFGDDPYLHIANSDASRDRRYRLADEFTISWAPRGRVLAYESAHLPKRVYLVRPDRGTITVEGADHPSWAPDGRAFAFERRRSIYVADALGSRRTRVSRGVDPAWSPDGTAIAFVNARCGPRQGVQTVNPAGRMLRRLTDFCFIGGSARSELLRGTRGIDLIRAGSGDDVVLVRDSKRDVVICGPGRDTVTADRVDRLAGCEIVHRPPRR